MKSPIDRVKCECRIIFILVSEVPHKIMHGHGGHTKLKCISIVATQNTRHFLPFLRREV